MVRVLVRTLFFVLVLLWSAVPLQAAPKRHSIGCILTADTPHYQKLYADFVAALAQRGYDRQKIDIYLQTPNPDQISWANAARKLKGLDVDLIVTFGGAASVYAFREVRDVPILYLDVFGPVELGLSRSMSGSGNHATGISSKVPLLTLFRAVADTRPVKTVGILFSSREAGSQAQAVDARRTAAQMGISVRELTLLTLSDIDINLPKLLKGVDALFVTESVLGQKNLDRILKRAVEAHVPVVTTIEDAAAKGALFTLAPDVSGMAEQGGELAVRILSGSSPGALPIGHPRKVELIANLKTARQLEITVPFPVLSAVTKVIK